VSKNYDLPAAAGGTVLLDHSFLCNGESGAIMMDKSMHKESYTHRDT
jgi:hypothetical protein